MFFSIIHVMGESTVGPTIINTDITEDTIWTAAGSPYIICLKDGGGAPEVAAGVTLTIGSGVEVQLGHNGTITVSETVYNVWPELRVRGSLIANEVTFTGFTGDGSQSPSWASLTFYDGSSGTFAGCTFKYGGSGASTYGMLMVDDGGGEDISLTVSDSTFRQGTVYNDAKTNGIYFRAGDGSSLTVEGTVFTDLGRAIHVSSQSSSNIDVEITGCTISDSAKEQDDGQPMVLERGRLSLTDCTFMENGKTDLLARPDVMVAFQNNHFDGGNLAKHPLRIIPAFTLDNVTFEGYPEGYREILVEGGEIASGVEAYWGQLTAGYSYKLPYFVPVGGKLTIAPGQTLLLDRSKNIQVLDTGRIEARGTEDEPILFRGYGSGTFDNGGILVLSQGNGNPNIFEHCIFDSLNYGIRYGYDQGVSVNLTPLSIAFCEFKNINPNNPSSYGAVNMKSDDGSSNLQISNTIIHNSNCNIIDAHRGNLTLTNVTFAHNSNRMYLTNVNTIIINSIIYNNVYNFTHLGGTLTASYSNIQADGVVAGVGNINTDPLFANPSGGDFHLKSEAGRWDPAANDGNGDWVLDAVTSPCIDAGDPASDYSNEPTPNGGRINMGAYGNTVRASKSPVTGPESLTGSVSIIGTLKYGQTLTAEVTGQQGDASLSYQWKRNGSDINEASNSTYIIVDADIGATLSVVVTAINYSGSLTGTASGSIEKADDPTAPAAPTMANSTTTSITLTPNEGYEYSRGGVNWQSSNTFTGLTAGTTYNFYQRVAETVTHKASASSESASISTKSSSSGGSTGGDTDTSSGVDNGGTTSDTNKANITAVDTNGNIITAPMLDENTGVAAAEINSTILAAAFEKTGQSSDGKKIVEITIPFVESAKAYDITMPASVLSSSNADWQMKIKTDIAMVILPGSMLPKEIVAGAENVSITIAHADVSSIGEEIKNRIGDRPVIQLSLTVDGELYAWNNENASVTVSIPYTPTPTELIDSEHIVVWYIDENGNVVSVPNGRYDPATGTVTFTTTHFSYYAVSYKQVSFKDVAAGAWYVKAVSFIAARDITTGTGNGNFSPEAKLTRGQFIVMLMKAYGITPDANPKDNFVDAGNTWYTGYLAAAKRLGISAGVGNNLFAPEKEITRQEMFTLLYNGLKVIGKLPQGDSGKSLSSFSDADDIALWAKDAMKLLVETGTISGSGNRLSPKDTTTRAQMAQVLYSLLSK